MQNNVLSGQLNLSRTQSVLFGPDCVKNQLCAQLDMRGWKRVFVLSTGSLERNGLLEQLKDTVGERIVGTFSGSAPHTPKSVVMDAVRLVKESNADVLISFGGSSVVDLAKAVALVAAEGDQLDDMYVKFSPETGLNMPPLPAEKLPHISIPTTLSGAEYTFAAAITDEIRKEKNLYVDPKLTPLIILQDAALCTPTPNHLWVATGMKVFADCLETLTSPRATPYTSSSAMEALRLLFENLSKSVSDKENIAAKQNCLMAAFMVMSVAANTGLGLVSGIRHQLGGNQGLSHGEASTIMLPHVMRWNASSAQGIYADIGRRLGVFDR